MKAIRSLNGGGRVVNVNGTTAGKENSPLLSSSMPAAASIDDDQSQMSIIRGRLLLLFHRVFRMYIHAFIHTRVYETCPI